MAGLKEIDRDRNRGEYIDKTNHLLEVQLYYKDDLLK